MQRSTAIVLIFALNLIFIAIMALLSYSHIEKVKNRHINYIEKRLHNE